MSRPEPILLTGATGYIGGRLLDRLQRRGLDVRCLTRNPTHVKPWLAPTSTAIRGDLTDRASLAGAMDGVHTAVYLVHSMAAGGDFVVQDRAAAQNFAAAARRASVRRIVYLGGLGSSESLSPHLASRQEVGRILRESGVPTLEFQASIIIGSGSLSFEMIRALVERLPIMTTPRWVRSLAQPIAVEDVLDYLEEGIRVPLTESRVYPIGGADRASYGDIMLEYARQRGLRRWILPVPVLTPRLSSAWLGLVTPVYARVGRELIEGVRNDTVVTDATALRDFSVQPRGLASSIERALRREDAEYERTRWSDAISSAGRARPASPGIAGPRLVDSRQIDVRCDAAAAFAAVAAIGGDRGWYFANALWRLRGWIDLLLGGPGMRRGRRHPSVLHVGETVDFWRVEALEADRLLRLAAEMRLPGRAWLQFEVEPHDAGARICQIAIFDARGVFGRLYWFALRPVHTWMFEGMLRGIARAATRRDAVPRGSGTSRRVVASPRAAGAGEPEKKWKRRMRRLAFVLPATTGMLLASGATVPADSVTVTSVPITVPHVDLQRYAGLWYEIAKIPNRFQKACDRGATAQYTLRDDGKIEVINRCIESNGNEKQAKGVAKVEDAGTNSKLKVSFVSFLGIRPFWGDYWILGLGPDYDYAVVGSPDRKYGWILCRDPEMPEETRLRVFALLREQGYDPADFEPTRP
jgi:lipocalin/uncharacterized protein YbjT (DUF2867 family)